MQTKDPVERREYYTWNNAIKRLSYGIAGSRKAYDALNKQDRIDVRTVAKQLHELGKDIPTAVEAEKTNKQGFVYVITNKSAFPGFVKIGRAFNPESRLRGYQTGCPFRGYRLAHAVYFHDCHQAELEIHARLDRLRMRGEWFKVTSDEASHEINQLREVL